MTQTGLLNHGQRVRVSHEGTIVSGPDGDGDYSVRVEHPTMGEDDYFVHRAWLEPIRDLPRAGDVWQLTRFQVFVTSRPGEEILSFIFDDGSQSSYSAEEFLTRNPDATRIHRKES